MPLILPVTEVRDRLSAILDQVASDNEPVFITRHGRAQAVLLSTTQYEALTKHRPEAAPADWYALSQASLARVWDHPDEDVYTWEDGEPL
ncbi:MAG TPA: type II toxin-antitoxin system Phd/YefM family antitoxin [Anaerolineae bacterium]|nr:type II toxin-antitoxin system Phd/YefM family antitoxin [Anaerolineae bacterium]